MEKNDYFHFDFTPIIHVNLKLQTNLTDSKLHYKYNLTRFHSGKNINSGNVKINFYLAGFMLDKPQKSFERTVDPELEKIIRNSLPKPGYIKVSRFWMGLLSNALKHCKHFITINP